MGREEPRKQLIKQSAEDAGAKSYSEMKENGLGKEALDVTLNQHSPVSKLRNNQINQ